MQKMFNIPQIGQHGTGAAPVPFIGNAGADLNQCPGSWTRSGMARQGD